MFLKAAKNQTSSAVGDYVQYLPEIEALVQTEPAAARHSRINAWLSKRVGAVCI